MTSQMIEEHIAWTKELFEDHITWAQGLLKEQLAREQEQAMGNSEGKSEDNADHDAYVECQLSESKNWLEEHIRVSAERLRGHVQRSRARFAESEK